VFELYPRGLLQDHPSFQTHFQLREVRSFFVLYSHKMPFLSPFPLFRFLYSYFTANHTSLAGLQSDLRRDDPSFPNLISYLSVPFLTARIRAPAAIVSDRHPLPIVCAVTFFPWISLSNSFRVRARISVTIVLSSSITYLLSPSSFFLFS